MFNVCPSCGLYSEDKTIEPQDGQIGFALAICTHCGHGHPFRRLPTFVLTGASGAGKSAVCLALARAQLEGEAWPPDCVFLEQDILWRAEFARAEDEYRTFRNLWLRVAKNVGQGGRPVVLCGSGVPRQYEACPERRYFTAVHYLALVCDDDLLVERLEARPGWRRSGDAEFVREMVTFNRWFRENAQQTEPPIALLDNTTLSVQECAERVAEWVRSRR
jgi:shikimate kinase